MRCINNYYCNDCKYKTNDGYGNYCKLKLEQDGYAITENLVLMKEVE
jgi:hypothetical protein